MNVLYNFALKIQKKLNLKFNTMYHILIISTILLFILGTVLALFQMPVFVLLLILSAICYITATSYKQRMNEDKTTDTFNQNGKFSITNELKDDFCYDPISGAKLYLTFDVSESVQYERKFCHNCGASYYPELFVYQYKNNPKTGVSDEHYNKCYFCGEQLTKEPFHEEEQFDENIVDKRWDKEIFLDNCSKPTSRTSQYIFSFLIPLIGFILGAILLSKEDKSERESGTNCILLGLLSLVVSGVIVAIYLSK